MQSNPIKAARRAFYSPDPPVNMNFLKARAVGSQRFDNCCTEARNFQVAFSSRKRCPARREKRARELWNRSEHIRWKEVIVADTTKIKDKTERKKLKRAARKKAAPKAKRTTPRGSLKKRVKKMVRGQSKR
jgi:hypothetical protein